MTTTITAAESVLQANADRLVSREVHLCLSSMVATLAQAFGHADRSDSRLRDLDNLAEQASELCAPVLDYEEAAREAGWLLGTAERNGGVWYHTDDEAGDLTEYVADDAETICEANDIEPHECEVYEHWAVSQWLAEKLIAAGERVDTDFAGLNVWARTTTGQAISMDAVIRTITTDLHANAPAA